MPVENQAERVITPLRAVDRRVLVLSAVVAVLAVIGGLAFALTRPGDPPGVPCFTATYPSSMGGAVVHHCGAAAVHYCAVDAGIRQVAQACRREGFEVGSK